MLVGLNRLPVVRGTRAIQNQMLAMSGLINNGSRRLRLDLQARMRRSGSHWDSFPPLKAVPLPIVGIARPIGRLVVCKVSGCKHGFADR